MPQTSAGSAYAIITIKTRELAARPQCRRHDRGWGRVKHKVYGTVYAIEGDDGGTVLTGAITRRRRPRTRRRSTSRARDGECSMWNPWNRLVPLWCGLSEAGAGRRPAFASPVTRRRRGARRHRHDREIGVRGRCGVPGRFTHGDRAATNEGRSAGAIHPVTRTFSKRDLCRRTVRPSMRPSIDVDQNEARDSLWDAEQIEVRADSETAFLGERLSPTRACFAPAIT